MTEQMAQASDFGIDRSIVNGSLSFIDRVQSHTPAPTIRLIISGQRCICDASVFVLGNSKGNDPDLDLNFFSWAAFSRSCRQRCKPGALYECL